MTPSGPSAPEGGVERRQVARPLVAGHRQTGDRVTLLVDLGLGPAGVATGQPQRVRGLLELPTGAVRGLRGLLGGHRGRLELGVRGRELGLGRRHGAGCRTGLLLGVGHVGAARRTGREVLRRARGAVRRAGQ